MTLYFKLPCKRPQCTVTFEMTRSPIPGIQPTDILPKKYSMCHPSACSAAGRQRGPGDPNAKTGEQATEKNATVVSGFGKFDMMSNKIAIGNIFTGNKLSKANFAHDRLHSNVEDLRGSAAYGLMGAYMEEGVQNSDTKLKEYATTARRESAADLNKKEELKVQMRKMAQANAQSKLKKMKTLRTKGTEVLGADD